VIDDMRESERKRERERGRETERERTVGSKPVRMEDETLHTTFCVASSLVSTDHFELGNLERTPLGRLLRALSSPLAVGSNPKVESQGLPNLAS
jgi:hypothetical protein